MTNIIKITVVNNSGLNKNCVMKISMKYYEKLTDFGYMCNYDKEIKLDEEVINLNAKTMFDSNNASIIYQYVIIKIYSDGIEHEYKFRDYIAMSKLDHNMNIIIDSGHYNPIIKINGIGAGEYYSTYEYCGLISFYKYLSSLCSCMPSSDIAITEKQYSTYQKVDN